MYCSPMNPRFLASAPSSEAMRSALTGVRGYDLLFVLTALAFELLIIGILIAEKRQRHALVKALGMLWLLLAIPLAIVFVDHLVVGSDRWIVVSFGLIFLYMAVEALFDYVLKIKFRQQPIIHIPYIILEYGALFGLIRIAFSIGPTWGYLVSIIFWLLLGTVFYVYWDQITHRKRRSSTN